jgi:hypothetical protein
MRLTNYLSRNNSLFNEFVCKLGLPWHKWARLKGFKGPRVPKRAQPTHERVEHVFLYELLQGSKSLKIFKISLMFLFDKL